MNHSVFPMPIGEEQRLETLLKYEVLDSGKEADYSAIVELIAQIAGTPIAAISLIDRNRCWFKAITGMDATEIPREQSICTHAIVGNEMLVVEDASVDPRFANHPLIAEENGVRFYAGMPLVTPDGHALGTLCIADRKPRTLSNQEAASLQTLARCIVSLLEYRRMQGLVRELLQVISASTSSAQHAEQMERARLAADEASDIEKDIRTPVSLISLAASCSSYLGEENAISQIKTASDQVEHSSYRINNAVEKIQKVLEEENLTKNETNDDADSM